MRGRSAPVLALVVSLLLVCASGARAHSRLAPADEYFGPTNMSPIEITNRINDAERRGGSYRGLITTQSAIEDWTRKYPGDPWIPSREYRMSHLFARLHSSAGNAEAADCRSFMRAHFPGNSYTVAAAHEGTLHVAGTQVARTPAKTSATPAKTSARVASAPTSAKSSVSKSAPKKKHRFLGIAI